VALGFGAVKPANGAFDADSIHLAKESSRALFPLISGIGTGVGRSLDFADQRLANQFLQGGLTLHGGDFRLAENFLGKIDGRFHGGIKTAIWLADVHEIAALFCAVAAAWPLPRVNEVMPAQSIVSFKLGWLNLNLPCFAVHGV